MSKPIRVAVAGAAGRLGSAIVERLGRDDRFVLTACLEHPEDRRLGGSLTLPEGAKLTSADGGWGSPAVLIDASVVEAVPDHAEHAVKDGVALVVAVTGLPDETLAALDGASKQIPVLIAPNLSLGVTVLVRLVRQAARNLAGFDVEISEIHHTGKRDSPSGTAAWLGREVAAERGLEWPDAARHGREGTVGPRTPGEIGIHSQRSGTTAGEHRVWLGGPGEHLELTHVAESRECFAAGAIEAVAWLASAGPGRYNMEDVIDGR